MLCHVGKAILVEVEILAVALIDLRLEGRDNVVAHGVDLVLPKEVRMEGAVYLPSVLGHGELLHVLPHAGGREKGMENGPNLFHVSEEGRDKRALDFELVILEIIVGGVGQDGAATNGLVVMGAVLRGFVHVAEGGVPVRFFGDQLVSDHVDEGNSQHAPNAGQEGLHLFKTIMEISNFNKTINWDYNLYFCNRYCQLIIKIPIVTKIMIEK